MLAFTCYKPTTETPEKCVKWFRVNKRDTKITSVYSGFSIADFEHVNTGWVAVRLESFPVNPFVPNTP